MPPNEDAERSSAGVTGVHVVESYRLYEPSIDVKEVVQRLLASVPTKYLTGLKQIQLRNNASLGRREWSGKKASRGLLAGRYYLRTGARPASIDLFVDNILSEWAEWVVRLRLTRDLVIGMTLFHELGHHIHRTIRPEYGNAERTAEEWARALMRLHIRRRFRIQRPFVVALSRIVNYFAKRLRRE